ATLSALVLIFVVAPFHLWLEQRDQIKEKDNAAKGFRSAEGNIRQIVAQQDHTSAIREHTEELQRQKRRDEREAWARRDLANQLAEFVEEAHELIVACRDHATRPPTQEIGRWKERVEGTLTERLGRAYVAKFNNIPEPNLLPSAGPNLVLA